MTTTQIILLVLLIVSTVIGYFLIRHVPSLLHTPLMSGMNALSGITLIGALAATAFLLKENHGVFSCVLGGLAILVAAINVSAGFVVTHRMLKMFKEKDND